LISTLSFTITVISLGDTVTIGTLPFTWWTPTTVGVIHLEALEAASFIGLIRLVFALSFTVTEVVLSDTLTVGTGPFGLWVATTFFVVIRLEAFEAALVSTFIGSITAFIFTVTHLVLGDTFSIATHELVFSAAADR
jgi:hypothetical protein